MLIVTMVADRAVPVNNCVTCECHHLRAEMQLHHICAFLLLVLAQASASCLPIRLDDDRMLEYTATGCRIACSPSGSGLTCSTDRTELDDAQVQHMILESISYGRELPDLTDDDIEYRLCHMASLSQLEHLLDRHTNCFRCTGRAMRREVMDVLCAPAEPLPLNASLTFGLFTTVNTGRPLLTSAALFRFPRLGQSELKLAYFENIVRYFGDVPPRVHQTTRLAFYGDRNCPRSHRSCFLFVIIYISLFCQLAFDLFVH